MSHIETLSNNILNNTHITETLNELLTERNRIELEYLKTEERLQNLADVMILELVNNWEQNSIIGFSKEVMVEEHFIDSLVVTIDVLKNTITTKDSKLRIELDPEVKDGGYLITIFKDNEATRVKCHRDFIKEILLLTEDGKTISLSEVVLDITSQLTDKHTKKE